MTTKGCQMRDKLARIENLVEAMSLDEKIGQLTMIRADFGDAGSELGAEKLAEIRKGRAGSVLDLKGVDAIDEGQKAAVKSRASVSRFCLRSMCCTDMKRSFPYRSPRRRRWIQAFGKERRARRPSRLRRTELR